MAGSPGQDGEVQFEIRPEAPGSAAARAVLTAYFRDIVGRHHRRAATDAEVAAAMRAEPSDDLCPPGGLLLLAWQDGTGGSARSPGCSCCRRPAAAGSASGCWPRWKTRPAAAR